MRTHATATVSPVLSEADLLRLLTELLALHQDAVRPDQGHASQAARHPGLALPLGAGEAASWERVRVPLNLLDHGATEHLGVASGEHDANRRLVVDLVALQ